MACCDLPCKHISNTGFSKSLCLASVNNRISKQPERTIDNPPFCLSELVWFSGGTSPQCWSQSCRGEQDTPFAIFLLFLLFFSRIRCAISQTCDRLATHVAWAALKPRGVETSCMTLLLWKHEVTLTSHVSPLRVSRCGSPPPGVTKDCIMNDELEKGLHSGAGTK